MLTVLWAWVFFLFLQRSHLLYSGWCLTKLWNWQRNWNLMPGVCAKLIRFSQTDRLDHQLVNVIQTTFNLFISVLDQSRLQQIDPLQSANERSKGEEEEGKERGRERKRKGKRKGSIPGWGVCDFFPFLPKLHFQFPFPPFPSSIFLFLSLSLRPFVCALKSHSSHLSL